MTERTATTWWQQTLSMPAPSRKFAALLAIPAVIALCVSGYLAYTTLTSSTVAGCSGSLFDCHSVLKSRWARWMGIPVSVLAAATYVGMLGALALSQTGSQQRRNLMWLVVTFCCLSAGMAAVWFIWLQAFVLKHLCMYCLTAHFCGLFLAIAILYRQPLKLTASSRPGLAALAGLLVLIAGQALGPKPVTYTIESYDSQPVSVPVDPTQQEVFGAPTEEGSGAEGEFAPPSEDFIFEPPSDVGVSKVDSKKSKGNVAALGLLQLAFQPISMASVVTYQQPTGNGQPASSPQKQQPELRRLASIGSIKLDVKQWPLCGSPDAKYVFVEMFDYSCPHCRRTHQQAIKGAKEKFGNELAIIALPLPLNTKCNNSVTQTGPKFIESCEIAKLAIAVWRVDPLKFNEFHNWMFEGDAKTFGSARAHAETLVDVGKLSTEINSSMVSGYVKKHVQIYNMVGRGEVPKLMFPTTSVVGEFTSKQGLIDMILQHAQLVPSR